MSTTRRRLAAFTIVELLVAMLVSGILITITTSTYMVFRRSIARDQARSDIDQNARIALDRMTRDIRQTPDLVTALPPDNTTTPASELEFQDGNANDLSYRRYYLVNGVLKLDTKFYSFNGTTRVPQSQVGGNGAAPTATVLSTQDIAENVTSLAIYGVSQVSITITTADTNGQNFVLRTVVKGRNI